MGTDYLVFPDLEAIASWALRQANIPGIGKRVYSSIPKRPTYPLIQIKRTGGGVAVQEALDAPRIQFEVWGQNGEDATTKGALQDIAQLARVALLRMQGVVYTQPVAAYVTAVRDSMGITWAPDLSTKRDRYIFAMNVYGKL